MMNNRRELPRSRIVGHRRLAPLRHIAGTRILRYRCLESGPRSLRRAGLCDRLPWEVLGDRPHKACQFACHRHYRHLGRLVSADHAPELPMQALLRLACNVEHLRRTSQAPRAQSGTDNVGLPLGLHDQRQCFQRVDTLQGSKALYRDTVRILMSYIRDLLVDGCQVNFDLFQRANLGVEGLRQGGPVKLLLAKPGAMGNTPGLGFPIDAAVAQQELPQPVSSAQAILEDVLPQPHQNPGRPPLPGEGRESWSARPHDRGGPTSRHRRDRS